MLNFIKEIICSAQTNIQDSNNDEDRKVQIATCALLIETANADDRYLPEERKKIIEIMKGFFGLEDEVIEELMELSEAEIRDSVSLYEFTDIINSNFTAEQKFEVLKNIWRLILVDDELDVQEDHIANIIGSNLHIYRSEIVKAKLIVKEEKKKGNR